MWILGWLRWPKLSSLYNLTLNVFSYAFWPLKRLLPSSTSNPSWGDHEHKSNGEQTHANTCKSSAEDSHNIIIRRAGQRSDNHELLIIGIFAEVYLIDKNFIRKIPRSQSEEDMRPIIREAQIYEILGVHPRIAEWLSIGRFDHVDIKYYPHGDLANYCQNNNIATELRSKWFQQILEAIVVIHSHDVIHSDLALRQFFLDDELNVRLGDFNSAQYPDHLSLGYEKASHCLPRDYNLPNSKASDIFALGSTLYELVAGMAPYSDLTGPKSDDPDVIKAQILRQREVDHEIESRYKNNVFPDVSGLFGGAIILACWRGQFSEAKEALDVYLNQDI
ncbi:kinase-like protein [Aspergillus coremiiformis]|uniref:Kinase-like protein n=1 Tax=Aspergillus coremiiformis TaxID=138285 RepID=A0A5N6YUE9_9EURO|nr:kinase-like protein [Aspergillus coremiiformis]